MDVAYLSFLFPNVKKTGGAFHAFNIVRELNKKVNLTVFIPRCNLKSLPEYINFVPVDFYHKRFLRMLSFTWKISKQIRKNNFDIIHSNELGGFFVNGIDVATFHHSPVTLRQKLHKFPTYITLDKADFITTVSEKTKKALLERGYENIKVIHNGVDPVFLNPIYHQKKEKLKEKYGIESEKVILFVNSNFSPRKNFPLALSTIIYLSKKGCNSKLLLVAPENKKVFVKNKFSRYGIEDKLIYVSNVPQDLMPYMYAISDFLIMPSFQEGFGLPLIEALACGKPFVSFDVGIAPELNRDGFGFIAENREDFKEKCLQLLKNPIEYPNAKKYVRDHYSWEKAAEKLVRIYEELTYSG